MPLAFIGTAPPHIQGGNLPIARPCTSRSNGESFGTLTRDVREGYVVVRGSGATMRFEGDFKGRSVTIYASGAEVVGSTRPCGNAYGQERFELHVRAGADAGLAILSLLAVLKIESSRSLMPARPSTVPWSTGSSLQLSPRNSR